MNAAWQSVANISTLCYRFMTQIRRDAGSWQKSCGADWLYIVNRCAQKSTFL